MTARPRIVAIVPMRHDSERVRGKNYRPFAGRPLFHHIIGTLLGCTSLAEVVIDTDSPVIRADVEQTFPSVRVLERPEHLRAGTVPMNAVLRYDVERLPADLYLQTHSTNPLLKSATVARAVSTFLEVRDRHDALMGVTRLQARLWDWQGRPINHDPNVLLRTQDLAPVFLENSCLYLFSGATLVSTGRRTGYRPMLFEIPGAEAWDIDEEEDFVMGEAIFHALAGR